MFLTRTAKAAFSFAETRFRTWAEMRTTAPVRISAISERAFEPFWQRRVDNDYVVQLLLICVRVYLAKMFRHDDSERRAESASELFLERPECWPVVSAR